MQDGRFCVERENASRCKDHRRVVIRNPTVRNVAVVLSKDECNGCIPESDESVNALIAPLPTAAPVNDEQGDGCGCSGSLFAKGRAEISYDSQMVVSHWGSFLIATP